MRMEPDSRGRTGLDRIGRDLTRNADVVVRDVEVTSDGWHVLRRTTFDYRRRDGVWETQQRETEEELGLRVGPLTHVFDVYMSPGSVTERLHFYAAPYTAADRTTDGGGVAAEGEDIEVLELPFDDALAMVADGRIADGKTIMLLQWAALSGPFASAARA